MVSDVSQLLSRGALLAPMLATTDIPFRAVCRSFGAGLVSTEMVSAKGVTEGTHEAFRCAVFDAVERPIAIQIAASRPSYASSAIRELAPFKPAVFDINCGCPNDRICDAGAGSKLLDDPRSLFAIVSAAVQASPVPVSAKVRMSGLRKEHSIRTIVRAVEDAGASFITVHARQRYAKYDQPAAWDGIAVAKSEASIPVVGNGDIFSAADAAAMRAQTGCDAVMVARGALGTPWIFRDIAAGLACGISEHAPSPDGMAALVHGHLSQIRREYGDITALPRVRKHALWYARRFAGSDALRHEIFSRDDAAFAVDRVDAFFEAAPAPLDPLSPAGGQIEAAFRKRVLYWMQTEEELAG